MEVLVKIPKDLEPYVEYIPSEVLPKVISRMVKDSILRETEESMKPKKESADLAELLALLQSRSVQVAPVEMNEVVGSNQAVMSTPAIEQSEVSQLITPEKAKIVMFNTESSNSDEDDDLDLFADMMK